MVGLKYHLLHPSRSTRSQFPWTAFLFLNTDHVFPFLCMLNCFAEHWIFWIIYSSKFKFSFLKIVLKGCVCVWFANSPGLHLQEVFPAVHSSLCSCSILKSYFPGFPGPPGVSRALWPVRDVSRGRAPAPGGPRRFVPSADGSVCGLRSQLTSLPRLCLRIRPSWESCMGLPQLSHFRGLPIKFLTSCHLPLTPTSDSELQVSSLFPVFSAKFAAFIQNAPEHRSSTHIPNPVSLPPRCSEAAGCPVQPLPVKLPC